MVFYLLFIFHGQHTFQRIQKENNFVLATYHYLPSKCMQDVRNYFELAVFAQNKTDRLFFQ